MGVRTRAECLSHIGKHFRTELGLEDAVSDAEAGEALLERHIFIHLDKPVEKMHLLVFMIQKLYALANGQCAEVRRCTCSSQRL